MRPRFRRRCACAATTVLSAAGCAAQAPAEPPSAAGSPAAVPERADAEVAPTAGCPRPPAAPAAASGGSALRATTLSFGAPNFNADVALSAEALAALPEALSTTTMLDMDQAYLKGGFAAGGGYAQVSLENTTGSRLSVYDVRPVNIVVECVPLAAMIAYGNEGGDPSQMVFNMDADDPMPRLLTDNGEMGGPYFERYPAIEFGAHEKQSLLFSFLSDLGAYTFELLIAYEADGRKGQAVIRNGFVPFRITTDLCPHRETRMSMTPGEVDHMRSLRYGEVRQRGPRWTPDVVAPDEWARRCEAW